MTPIETSDGCSGFWLFEALFPIRDCCAIHDAGGSDGMLLDCLMAATPSWTWPLVGICVVVMIVFRPLYHRVKPWLNPLVLKVRALCVRASEHWIVKVGPYRDKLVDLLQRFRKLLP